MERNKSWFANKKQTAVFFGISIPSFDNWIAKGCPHERAGRSLKFYLPEVAAWRHARRGPGNLEEERTRLTKEQADKTELENKKLRGELFERDAVAAVVDKLIGGSRSKLLSIPTKAAPHVMGCQSVAEVEEILKDQIYEALNDLATTDAASLLGSAPAGTMEASAETDNKPVGRRVQKAKSGKQRRTRAVANQ